MWCGEEALEVKYHSAFIIVNCKNDLVADLYDKTEHGGRLEIGIHQEI